MTEIDAADQAPPDDDPIPGLVGFTVVLRSAGLAVTTDRVAAFLARSTPST